MAKMCIQCGKKIPKTRGNRAKTCSEKCGNAHRAAQREEWAQRPEVKERKAAYWAPYNQRPEVKARRAAYQAAHRQRPEVKAHMAAYKAEWAQRPEVKARRAAYQAAHRQRPEAKERARECKRERKKFKRFVDMVALMQARPEWEDAHPVVGSSPGGGAI